MGKTEYKVINGKEYLVYTNDEGCETVMGDPMGDLAKAQAKAIREELDNSKPTFTGEFERSNREVDENMERTLDYIDEQSFNKIIKWHEEHGDYEIDPRYGITRFIPGTDEYNPEYLKILAKESNDGLNRVKNKQNTV